MTGEAQKTGSIYNFDARKLDEIGTPREGWNDYEIEVVGQRYRIYRNGELINEFDNVPGLTSSRQGDPPSSQRQFSAGYVGLQNHGGADTMQYRDIRVEDLSADAPGRNQTGAFTVSGLGPHTVEIRSVDAAGNIEAKQAVDFEIGSSTPGGAGGTGQTPVPPASDDTPATFRLAGLASRMSAKRFAKRGLAVQVRCTGAMSGRVTLRVTKATARKLRLRSSTVATRDVRCYGEHTATVRLKASKSTRRKLRKAAAGKQSVKLHLSATMEDLGRPAQTIGKTVTLR